MQSYANPQSLNRYTYVLNNPLKYTDPTGLIVEFENEADILASLASYAEYGMDYAAGSTMDQMVQDWGALRTAYEDLRTSDDSEVASLAQELYDNPNKVVKIGFGDTGDAGGSTLPTDWRAAVGDVLRGEGANIDWKITIERRTASMPGLPVLMSHELYHAHDALLSDSIDEETRANRFSDRLAAKYGLPVSGYSGLDPNTFKGRLDAWSAMTQPGQPAFYASLSLRPAVDRWDDLKVAYGHYQWSRNHQ